MGSNERWLCGLVGMAFLALAGTALAKPPVGFSPPGLQSHPNHSHAPFSSGTTFGPTNGGGFPAGCDANEVAVAKGVIDDLCPCAGSVSEGELGPITVPWKNHGQYVSCIAKARQSAGVPLRCLTDVVPCAAQSTCGKTDDVACIITTTGTCVGGPPGVCSNDSAVECNSDDECTESMCAVTALSACVAPNTVAVGNCCSFSPLPDQTLAPVSGSLPPP